MAYRIQHAETEEERAKEQAFTGLGLTSRKNLCIHPEVSSFMLGRPKLRLGYTGVKGEEGEGSRCEMS
jgi:hypothetical protein